MDISTYGVIIVQHSISWFVGWNRGSTMSRYEHPVSYNILYICCSRVVVRYKINHRLHAGTWCRLSVIHCSSTQIILVSTYTYMFIYLMTICAILNKKIFVLLYYKVWIFSGAVLCFVSMSPKLIDLNGHNEVLFYTGIISIVYSEKIKLF